MKILIVKSDIAWEDKEKNIVRAEMFVSLYSKENNDENIS